MTMPMMKCGHTAQGHQINKDGKIPYCLICDCIEQAEIPNLAGRTARCSYFGKAKPNRRFANDECNYGCRGNRVCDCGEQPSEIDLPFFKHHPDKERDEFYCGCFGWD